MEYETIELEIGPGNGREYPIAVRSLAGEAHAIMQFPFDELALENRLLNLQNALLRSGGQRRQILSTEQETVQKFGQDLFNALMTSDIRLYYEKSADRAQQEGKGLRLQLRIQPPEMATLPWEFMYDARRATYLALSPRTPITRYLNLPQTIDPLLVEPPLRILGMIANPQGVLPLDTQREKERLERAVASLQQRDLIELTWLQGETWRDLQRAMRNKRWHIFHFVGHGGFDTLTDEGFVVLSDEQHQPHLLPATQLAELLTGYYPPRLVLLNACDGAQSSKRDIFSSTASILIRRGIPAVAAMQYEITDRAAIEFSNAFYEAIATGLSIETAMSEARKAIWISISNTFEWGTPVLYTHTPDGILFRMKSRNDVAIRPQDAVASSGRTLGTPQDSTISPDEQKPRKIEEESKAKESSPEEVATTKLVEVKHGQSRAEQAQVSPSRSSPLPTSTVSVLTPISIITKQTFFLQWLLANVAGVAVGVAVVGVVGGAVDGAVGVAVGVAAQWFILRQYIRQAHWWILASAVGGVAGVAVGGVVAFAVGGAEDMAGIGVVAFAVGGAVAGAAQWFILRQCIRQAHWWILASSVGWAVVMSGVRVGIGVVAMGWDVFGIVAVVVGWTVAGIGVVAVAVTIYTVITILPLFGLLRRSTSNQTAE